MALTDTALKALKPKEKTYAVTDSRGLYVEVFPSGGIAWRYRYRLNGKHEKLSLGKYPNLTLKNARMKRDEAAQLVALGQSPAQKKQQAKIAGPEDVTVAEFADRFFKDIQQRDRKNTTMPRRYLDKDILPHIGNKPIKDLTAEDVRSVIWRKKGQGFDAAARERALTEDEIRRFLRAMQRSNIRRQFKIAFQLILMTLVRKSELLLAQWQDVHLDQREWRISVENSKTGKPHIVYLSTQAATLFRELKTLASTSDWVLPSRGTLTKPFAHNALNSALKVSLQDQNIPAFTIHDLRRTASTLLHEQGWLSDVVEKALNHTIGGVCGVDPEAG